MHARRRRMIAATYQPTTRRADMTFAADYPFLNILWTMIIFFVWLIWIWTVVSILADVFSRHDISGWGKAAWLIFVVVLPFLGVLVYLIANGNEMHKRDAENARAARAEFDDYVKSTAGAGGPAAEIDKAKQLLDSGAITQAEFDAIKAKAIA
jgi:Phospholipase_D-nuclease N-terminal/Short C-terminal domain